ncbi:Gluconate utilization system GNT-I transcriptional repressor [Raoultella planticola]|uniref:Gluconate utilization system GNT-I transcriptional repressor n=1 Tax=Raoultella planticola TaxID=575 RepID=A0A485C4A5_RAOPL|nr:Gluconate utilization system GNT-I transcriptional repressor [Raoultella planticola]
MSLTRKRRSTGKVTLADVAQLAGVGTMTVSRALRTPEQVSDKLREKIEAAVQELGYMPQSCRQRTRVRFIVDHRDGGT